jgi:hypothetical protein
LETPVKTSIDLVNYTLSFHIVYPPTLLIRFSHWNSVSSDLCKLEMLFAGVSHRI